MLDERKASILRAVVEEYIQTAQPVGSSHVARASGVSVSPATVRNEMAVLEDEGYLDQPHTSAGRVPTEKGYRFFVDSLSEPGRLGAAETQQVRSFFAKAHGELEQMLADTSRLLSNITDYAAVVVAPPHEVATVRSAQLVGLSPRVALLVVVFSNGAVDKHTVELDAEVDEIRVNAAGAHLAAHLVGETLRLAPEVPSTGDPDTDAIVAAARRTLVGGPDDADPVFVGGTARMLASFDAVDTVRRVLTILEQQLVVVTLVRDVLDRGLSVAIGSETGVEPLAECSLVVAPYTVEGEGVGTVGVLGPTRMNYPQALAAVAVVSQRLGTRLSEG
ncbi:MAG TPA: heat-inducible transcriptional repressor HrcA [Acidimicrobiales bacterium]|nr:heat-inducible transcriptional repressor HrcA [Acidimicrobiales bacterium]